ncbi:MAG: hypothetical protein K8R73_08640 [Clostridiales bacterium]|nr:hypothetical protein [Clostridiales bacterium]
MIYILHSAYNDKLYQQIKSKGASIEYISFHELHLLNKGDAVIIDIFSHAAELDFFKENQKLCCFCMCDETCKTGKIMYVSKYQAIDVICSTIFDPENHMITIIGGVELFSRLQLDCKICNFVDFTYNPDSNLSLIDLLDNHEMELIKKIRGSKNRILYPISSLMDLLNPPIKLIEPLINTLKKHRNTIIHIDHLKGPLDLMLLNLSDLIIIVHDNIEVSPKRFESAIRKIAFSKKIISLSTNTKAHDQFKISEHMLLGEGEVNDI